MRGFAWVAVAALLLAGCAGPRAADDGPATPEAAGDGDDAASRTARGGRAGEGEGGNRTVAVVGAASGGATQAGTYPLSLQVPHGGATKVEWRLEVVPLAAFMLDGVQGPGCETTGWHSGITSSGTTGHCGTVQPGAHEWSFTLNAPVASYQVEVYGWVWDPAESPAHATER